MFKCLLHVEIRRFDGAFMAEAVQVLPRIPVAGDYLDLDPHAQVMPDFRVVRVAMTAEGRPPDCEYVAAVEIEEPAELRDGSCDANDPTAAAAYESWKSDMHWNVLPIRRYFDPITHEWHGAPTAGAEFQKVRPAET